MHKPEKQTVQEWLSKLNLSNLLPIFEKEQLLDWDTLQLVTIAQLQSIDIPLGNCLQIQRSFVEMYPKSKLSQEPVKVLLDWLKEQSKPERQPKILKRPPWCGTLDRAHSLPIMEAAKMEQKRKGKKEKIIEKPDKVQITKVLSFPETKLAVVQEEIRDETVALAAERVKEEQPIEMISRKGHPKIIDPFKKSRKD
ncbi:hypothetical protein HDV06_001406 [Boothiomyces sp. JEL0866]|nr:hypothetical protein HDV06_001406 [Boothiomyces sp. JEL0866]